MLKVALLNNLDSSKSMCISLTKLYYYSFLSTFTVIIFVNLLPSSLIVITRPFVIFSGLLSLLLLSSTRALFYVLLLFIFIIIYILYPLLVSNVEVEFLVKNTRYLIYFFLLFGLIKMSRDISLDQLLYSMSKVFVLKLTLVAMVSVNMNILGGVGADYILSGMDLIVHQLFGAYRVFDLYLFLFPLVFIYTQNKSSSIKVLVHILLLFNVLSSMTFGIIFSYIVIMLLKYKFLRWVTLVFGGVFVMVYYEFLYTLYETFLVEKSISIDVKLNQILFLIDNVSIFGQGLGRLIIIEGRVDSMLENIYIYWIVVYGIVGSVFILLYFVFFPFLICYLYKDEFLIKVLFFIHLSVLLVSSSNPYLESVIGIMPMMFIVAYFFSKRDMLLREYL